ncbi:HNH endonuclease [Deinococcus budaensis]
MARQLVEAPGCLYCHQPNLAQGQGFCLDHRTPLIRGERNEMENIAIVCESCNRAKWDKTEMEYRDWLNQLVRRLSAES